MKAISFWLLYLGVCVSLCSCGDDSDNLEQFETESLATDSDEETAGESWTVQSRLGSNEEEEEGKEEEEGEEEGGGKNTLTVAGGIGGSGAALLAGGAISAAISAAATSGGAVAGIAVGAATTLAGAGVLFLAIGAIAGVVGGINAIINAVNESTCTPSHPLLEVGLCYKKCDKGYNGVGPYCWRDHKRDCKKYGKGRNRRNEDCPENYRKHRCKCIYKVEKKTRYRGNGIVPPRCNFFKDKFSCNHSSSKQCIWNEKGIELENGKKQRCFRQHKGVPIACLKVLRPVPGKKKLFERQCHPIVFVDQKELDKIKEENPDQVLELRSIEDSESSDNMTQAP